MGEKPSGDAFLLPDYIRNKLYPEIMEIFSFFAEKSKVFIFHFAAME